MRAVRVHDYGGPEVMRLEDVPRPEPGEGQALLRLAVSGVNFIDIYQRLGQYKTPLPFTAGNEGAGEVVAIGSGVSEVRVGDRVAYANIIGSYAEYALVPASRLVVLPEGVDYRLAAATMLQGMTAHYLSHSTYPLKPGDACLVHAAAGGVGQLLVQMAKHRGARVLATAGTEEKVALARALGADEAINYTKQDFVEAAKRFSDGTGLQVVYDSVGRDTFDRSLDCLAARGYMVLFGQASGPVPPISPQLLNAKGSLFLTRPTLGNYVASRQELVWRASTVLEWVTSGAVKVDIGAELPLAEAPEAHRRLAARQTTGKVLLAI
ncbi:MAG: quinone oxidoreductase [Chloroflexi bacterium]|nr:quinone oxidoreductase [Chloroflexota bacterium]MCL5108862.1 quinone oxidoreductase [Chloroflexota bacterium]